MSDKRLRNESSNEGRTIWKAVNLAASRAPEWIKERAKPSSQECIEKKSSSDEKRQ